MRLTRCDHSWIERIEYFIFMELVYVRRSDETHYQNSSKRSARRVSMIARSSHEDCRAGCRSSFEIFPLVRFFIARSPSTERERAREWANGSSIWNSSKLSRRSVLEIDVMSARTGRDTGLLYFSSTRMRSERSARAYRIYLDHRRSDTVKVTSRPAMSFTRCLSRSVRQSCITVSISDAARRSALDKLKNTVLCYMYICTVLYILCAICTCNILYILFIIYHV